MCIDINLTKPVKFVGKIWSCFLVLFVLLKEILDIRGYRFNE